uniref:Uncharacterized protein n=1 Tax=Tetranychus urticae TaxID=32264 RepID=T1K6M2_TETUR
MLEIIKRSTQKIKDWYLVYELTTNLYMLEPWEKLLFNSMLLVSISLFIWIMMPK